MIGKGKKRISITLREEDIRCLEALSVLWNMRKSDVVRKLIETQRREGMYVESGAERAESEKED